MNKYCQTQECDSVHLRDGSNQIDTQMRVHWEIISSLPELSSSLTITTIMSFIAHSPLAVVMYCLSTGRISTRCHRCSTRVIEHRAIDSTTLLNPHDCTRSYRSAEAKSNRTRVGLTSCLVARYVNCAKSAVSNSCVGCTAAILVDRFFSLPRSLSFLYLFRGENFHETRKKSIKKKSTTTTMHGG